MTDEASAGQPSAFDPNAPMRLSALTRLSLSLAHDLDHSRDPSLFDASRYAAYKLQYVEAVARRDKLARTMVFLDFALLLVINGRTFEIPGIGLSILDLPSVLEATGALASLTFMFLAIAFFNEQAYLGLFQQFNVAKAQRANVDPDLLTAGDVFQELFVKASLSHMNVWGHDIYKPRSGFRRVFGAIRCAVILSVLTIGLGHFALICSGLVISFTQGGFSIAFLGFAMAAASTNFAAIALFFMPFRSFEFDVNWDKVLADGEEKMRRSGRPQTPASPL